MSSVVSPTPLSIPSSMSIPLALALSLASQRRIVALPGSQPCKQRPRMGFLVASVPVGASAGQPAEIVGGDDPRRNHERKTCGLLDLAQPVEQEAVVARFLPEQLGIFAHGEVDEVDSRLGKSIGCNEDLIRRFAIPRRHWVALPVLAEHAVIAAEGREVDKSVQEYLVPEMFIPGFTCRLKNPAHEPGLGHAQHEADGFVLEWLPSANGGKQLVKLKGRAAV